MKWGWHGRSTTLTRAKARAPEARQSLACNTKVAPLGFTRRATVPWQSSYKESYLTLRFSFIRSIEFDTLVERRFKRAFFQNHAVSN